STTTTITCFNDQANTLTRDVNEVVAELTNKDPYTLLPSLKQLEGTTHIFQFHFDAMITSRRPDFILDKVFAYPILAFPPANPIQIHKPSATSEQHQTLPKPLTSTETKQSPTDHRKEELKQIHETTSTSSIGETKIEEAADKEPMVKELALMKLLKLTARKALFKHEMKTKTTQVSEKQKNYRETKTTFWGGLGRSKNIRWIIVFSERK
nr:nucleic acid-binding, OB-fold protein [Tanacetum cinerariifolium]